MKLTAAPLLSALFLLAGCGSPELNEKISFLPHPPVIDGQLDAGLEKLKKRDFNYIWQFDNPVTDTVPVTYRMAYTPTHLYLYIEAEADSISFRSRGFINGDGFKLLLGIPQPDSLTDEYYDMVFSASKDKGYWARKRIWEYNHSQGHGRAFSEATVFEESTSDGKSGFEALVAWKDIEPYHPWFLEAMGFNLYFAKGIGDTITNGYAVVEDEGIWDEELPRRKYQILHFEAPARGAAPALVARPRRKNLGPGAPLVLETAALGPEGGEAVLSVSLSDDSAIVILKKDIRVSIGKELLKREVRLEGRDLLPGRYHLLVRSAGDTLSSNDIVVFPDFGFDAIRAALQDNKDSLKTGTVNTLVFQLNQLQQRLGRLKPYEAGADILKDWKSLEVALGLFSNGTDPYARLSGPYRRAFRSASDGTYQPYTIKLPEGYDPVKKYPLLVFLHGSGQDEQWVLNQPRSGGNFIELAPLARDIYYCYSSDSSQTDILEAIDDVVAHFSVDTGKVVIGGFSMGGYGALRTFYEHPELYRGVAVFAGHPHLAGDWLGGEHPNFLEDKYLSAFSRIPVFIYHGRKDGSLPVEKAEALSSKLKKAGAIVTTRIVENKAHEYPDEEANGVYFDWLGSIIQ